MTSAGSVCGLRLPVSGSEVRKNIMEEEADSFYERQGTKKRAGNWGTDTFCEENLGDLLLSSYPTF